MSALVNYRGDNDLHSRPSLCSGDSGLLFSFNSHLDIYCPPRKRSRISGPCILKNISEDNTPSINILPDECLFEIFRRLPCGRERSSVAGVSKRWLTVLSSIRTSEFYTRNKQQISIDDDDVECVGFLTRCVEGKKATDVRLAAIAVGTSSRGGLGKLSIRGSNVFRGASDLGLSAIARGCPSLKALSLWNVPSISNEGLFEVARECHLLEKLDLCQCPEISDNGLVAIAESSPNLTSLSIESCSNIGNDSLKAIAKFCPKLQSISIKDCTRVGDQGVVTLLSSASALTKVKFQSLNITDYSVAVIGHYGKTITSLVLCGLQNVSQKGFWVMGNTRGLQSLTSLTIASCRGVTDLTLEAVGKGCPNLKHICVRKCCFVSDNGLIAFAKATSSLESLQLEECNRITQIGMLTALSSISSKLKSVSLIKCMGIKDISTEFPALSPCESGLVKVTLKECTNLCDEVVLALARLHGSTLELLNLDGCCNITDAALAAVAENCPMINELDVSRCWITDAGVAALSEGIQANLEVLSLSGCCKISNKSVPALERLGKNLVGLNLQHCNSISNSKVEMLSEKLWRCDILS